MSRNDAHLDAMLRHLGAAYYDSLHGRAAQADVTRALDSVAGQLGEEAPKHPATASPVAAEHNDPGSRPHSLHHQFLHSRPGIILRRFRARIICFWKHPVP